ncbi:MAG: LTA synthase family protein [Planctomycetaceae bacterium]
MFDRSLQLGRRFSGLFGRSAYLLEILAIAMAFFALLRVVLVLTFVDGSAQSGSELMSVFLVGFRFDLLVALILILPQSLYITLVSNRRVAGLSSRIWLEFGWIFAFTLLAFDSVVEFLFFEDFQTRLNYIAFEYLVYPTEVCCNIWESYPVIPLIGLVITVGGCLYLLVRRRFFQTIARPTSFSKRFGLLACHFLAVFGLWSTTDMADIQVTPNRVANECAANGLYSFVYYAITCRFDYEGFYKTIEEKDAIARVRKRVVSAGDQLHSDSQNPLDRTVFGTKPQQNWNVVLILEESFGANYVGELGDDRELTPHFDKLTKRGLLFDNFYATGNRTARALEAVMTSLPPLPTESILKRDHSDHVYTLANVLGTRGYERLFMAAGTGFFDGVRSFMTANGFNHFIEQSDFESPVFTNAWGVSDEDLFQRALKEFDKLHQRNRPFFATLLTVSNHRPYTFPDGRIRKKTTTAGRRGWGVQYADWALGDFFKQARSHAFYKNTLFVVMGDHGSRVYGSQLFPMKSYRVPVLMILPEEQMANTRCNTLACSMDIAPTILGLLGGDYRSTFFGRDALAINPADGYALMQHNHDIAFMDAHGRMAVLGARKSSSAFRWNPKNFELQTLQKEWPELTLDAIAFYQLADWLYYSDRCYPAELTPAKRPTALPKN